MIADRPQRLAPPVRPGELLKRFTERKERQALRQAADHNPAYLVLVRQLPCLKCGLEPAGEAAHVRYNSGAHGKHNGMGKKPADRWTVPLCGGCHRTDKDALHQVGEQLFWHLLGIDPLLLCEQLYAKRGDFGAMRASTLFAIAART